MRQILRLVTTTGLIVALVAPAAAQGQDSPPPDRHLDDVLRQIGQQIEQGLRQAQQLALAQRAGQPRRGGPPRQQERGPEVTETFSQTARLSANGTLDLGNLSGNVTVTGGGSTDIRIDAVKRTRGTDDAAGRARLQLVSIDVREQPNRVEIRTNYPENNDVRVAVDFTITVPQGATVILRSVSGNIRASNLRGEVTADTLSGNIDLANVVRIGSLKAVSGDITLSDSRAEEITSVSTLSGNLTVRNVTARSLDLNSVTGDISLTDTDVERGAVRTTSGDVSYAGSLARNGRYDFSTHSGDISLAVAATGFNVDASTFNGDVRSDYALTLGGGGGGRGQRRGPGQAVRGTFGDGGAVLALRTFNGDISISRR